MIDKKYDHKKEKKIRECVEEAFAKGEWNE